MQMKDAINLTAAGAGGRTAGIELEAHCRAQDVQAEAEERAKRLQADVEQWLSRVQTGYGRLREDVNAAIGRARAEMDQAGGWRRSPTPWAARRSSWAGWPRAIRRSSTTGRRIPCPWTRTEIQKNRADAAASARSACAAAEPRPGYPQKRQFRHVRKPIRPSTVREAVPDSGSSSSPEGNR